MAYSVIRMQEEIFFQIDAGETLEQPQALAVNVAPYDNVIPYVRIRSEPGLNVPGGAISPLAGGVSFRFFTAAVLSAPMESMAAPARTLSFGGAPPSINPLGSGDRFIYCGTGSDILVTGDVSGPNYLALTFSSGTTRDKTFTYVPATSATPATGTIFPAIVKPGGLLIWKCTNNAAPGAGSTATFWADIYLVCRGPS